jgi:hypothetical protein
LLLLFQKRSNTFVFETKFWIETKRFYLVLEILCRKAFVLVRFQKKTTKSFVLSLRSPGAIETFWFRFDTIFKNKKSFVLFLSNLKQTKTFQTGKKKLEIVRKSSVLFPLKPRYMETFGCNNKLIRFHSGFVFKLKKSPKRSDMIFKNFWNRLKRSAFVPIKSGPNQNVLVLLR